MYLCLNWDEWLMALPGGGVGGGSVDGTWHVKQQELPLSSWSYCSWVRRCRSNYGAKSKKNGSYWNCPKCDLMGTWEKAHSQAQRRGGGARERCFCGKVFFPFSETLFSRHWPLNSSSTMSEILEYLLEPERLRVTDGKSSAKNVFSLSRYSL